MVKKLLVFTLIFSMMFATVSPSMLQAASNPKADSTATLPVPVPLSDDAMREVEGEFLPVLFAAVVIAGVGGELLYLATTPREKRTLQGLLTAGVVDGTIAAIPGGLMTKIAKYAKYSKKINKVVTGLKSVGRGKEITRIKYIGSGRYLVSTKGRAHDTLIIDSKGRIIRGHTSYYTKGYKPYRYWWK
jgi:hypothetical protein